MTDTVQWTFLGMNFDTWLSNARTALKTLGSVAATVGVLDAAHQATLGTAVDSLVTAVGSLGVAAGWFWSLWHHTPDAPVTPKV